MRMSKSFFVISSANPDDKPEPFKPWFKKTQGVAEAEKMTTHQMRNHMKKKGWKVQELADRVLIMAPGLPVTLSVEKEVADKAEDPVAESASTLFALESHLRDFLARNLNRVIQWPHQLELIDTEYSTDVGYIDLLARDSKGDLVVFEFKLDRGPDAALGQILRYMAWCTRHLANGAKVHGVILAADITDKLRYAASMVPSVRLLEYELQFTATPVALDV